MGECAALRPEMMTPNSATPTTNKAARSMGTIVMRSSAATRVPSGNPLEGGAGGVRRSSVLGTRCTFVHGDRQVGRDVAEQPPAVRTPRCFVQRGSERE